MKRSAIIVTFAIFCVIFAQCTVHAVNPTSQYHGIDTFAIVCMAILLADEEDDEIEEENRRRCLGGLDLDSFEAMVMEQVRSNKRKAQNAVEDDNKRKRRYTPFNRERALRAINEDYFGPTPIFDDKQFQRIFRITRYHAEWIVQKLARSDSFWTQTWDCCNRMSIAPYVKLCAALKMAAYGESYNAWMDYYQMGESTARECLSKLTRGIVHDPDISAEFLRPMNKRDARMIERLHRLVHNTPGLLGYVDVNQILWGNCPHEQKGQYSGRSGKPTLALEIASDHNLWIWNWFFGAPGSLNDTNVWERSSLLRAMTHGKLHELDFEFEINGDKFTKLYYLVDSIYPRIARFLKSISVPISKIDHYFTTWHEGKRKGVERANGVFEKKFHSMAHPIRMFYTDDINYLVGGCVALHNMMVQWRMDSGEREGSSYYDLVADHNPQNSDQNVTITDAAAAAIAKEDAYISEEPASGVVDLNFREDQRRLKVLDLDMRYVEYYWSDLRDEDEHLRLQNAVKHHLYKDAFGDDSDAYDIASFNPLSKFRLYDRNTQQQLN